MLKKKLCVYMCIIMLTNVLLVSAVSWGNTVEKPAKEVLGFYTNEEHVNYDGKVNKLDSSLGVVMNNSDQISMVAPFWFRLSQQGKGGIEFHKYGFKTSQVEQEAADTVKQIKAKNVKVIALVHNMLYSGQSMSGKELAHQLLSNNDYRYNFINQLQEMMEKYDLDGVNIDIEGVYKSDRNNFSSFIRQLKETLGAKGYLVTVSVPAKTFDDPNNSYSYPFDYKSIAQYADRIAIMTYDEHGAWAGSGPGPIASIPWQENVIKYAVTQMPKEKILLGVPVYGFDWTKGKSWPKYSSYQMSEETAEKNGISVQWHQQYKVPYFKYKYQSQEREVWFEDSGSFKEKLNLMYKYDLKGIAIWRLGMEDPDIWDVIKDEMQVSKTLRSGAGIEVQSDKIYGQRDSIQVNIKPGYNPGRLGLEFMNESGSLLSKDVNLNLSNTQVQIPLSGLEDGCGTGLNLLRLRMGRQ